MVVVTPPRGLPLSGYLLRRYRPADQDQVVGLINADRLPGQPVATPQTLTDAVAGRSKPDARWWRQLTHLRTDVLVTTADYGERIVGVVSYARWPGQLAGVLLWLHARETPPAILTLIHHALGQLRECRHTYAFDLATPFTPGYGALPICHRPATATALRSLGFTATNVCHYMHRELPAGERLPATPITDTTITCQHTPDTATWTVSADRGGITVGQATITAPVDRVGELAWWLSLAKHDDRVIGQTLLHTALDQLRAAGAAEAIVHLPESPRNPSDRRLAEQLCKAIGFTEVDRLMLFTRPQQRGSTQPGLERPKPQDDPDDARPLGADSTNDGSVPLVQMLTTVETDTEKTFMIDPASAHTELTPEVFRILCDALETIKTHLRRP